MKPNNEYKSALAGICITLLITSLVACDWFADSDLNTNKPGASPGYNAGYEFGIKLALLRQQQPGIVLDEAFKGLLDALSETSQKLSSTEMCATLRYVENKPDEAGLKPAEIEFKPTKSVMPPQTQARSHGNIVDFATDDSAALNLSREGVVTLPGGVQYEVLTAGSGEQPQADDAIEIRYQAYLDNGTIIDSTDVDGGLLHMPLNDIAAPGLKEALLLMDTGARWQVVVPPNEGLRTTENRMLRGRESRMLRGRNLIYDIELISIERAQPAEASD